MSSSPHVTAHLLGGLAVALTVTLGACGGGGDAADWSAKPLEAVEVDVKGQAIRVSLPAGMARDAGSPLVVFQPAEGARMGMPKFTLSLATTGAPTAPEALELSSGTKQKPMTVVKRAAVSGGLLIAGRNSTGGTVEVRFFLPREGGGAVECRGVQARSEGVPNVEGTLAMLEKACVSMALR